LQSEEIASEYQSPKNRVQRALLREVSLTPAPIPVTRLWTACTRVKTRELQMQIFD
jgi:hypothetical protein